MNKKGFTLIELLAVIVILAIIALIATPIVLNIIEDTKQQAGLRSADFYLDALELSIAQATLDKTLDNKNITDGQYNILNNGNICLSYEDGKEKCAEELELEVKGEIINKGTVTIKNGQIDKVSLVQNNKIIEKDDKGELSYKKIIAPVSFAEDEWDTIIDNVKIGNTSVYEKNFNEGVNNTNKIKLTIDGTEKEYTVRMVNVSTPEECNSEGFSQTACGFVVEFVDIITKHAMNPTYTVSGHEPVATENYKTHDKIYLLSTKEVWGKEGTDNVIEHDTAEAETRQLDYYKKLGVTTENFEGAVKNYDGSAYDWWLRPAYSINTSDFFSVNGAGDWYGSAAHYTYGVAVAFRI